MKEKDRKRLRKVAARIKQIRLEKNLGQRELSSNCDVDYAKINKIEMNKANMLVTTLIELADGLGVHPKDLLDIDFD